MSETIVTRTGTIHRDEDGIVWIVAARISGQHGLVDAQENTSAVLRLAGGERVLLLIDIRQSPPLVLAARNHYANAVREFASALAMIIGSAFSRVIGNFSLDLRPNATPMRLFSSVDEAIAWLEQHRS